MDIERYRRKDRVFLLDVEELTFLIKDKTTETNRQVEKLMYKIPESL